MVEVTIHKLNISEEAKFDYAFLFNMLVGDFGSDLPPNFRLDPQIVKEVETYLFHNRKVWYKHYLRLTYIDELTDRELMLFILQKNKDGILQNWELVGICDADSWNEDAEESGKIRAWYNTKIDKIPKEKDWVVEMYAYKMIDKLEEIYDIGGRDEYIAAREEVARELSKQQVASDWNKEIEPRRIKYFIKRGCFDSRTADEIIGLLDRIIDTCRERVRD